LHAQEAERLPFRPSYPTDFNAYLRIGPDGRVTCLVGKVELGQGSMTALAMLLAEELDVALDRVDMVMGDTDLCPWDMGTFGSLSIWQFGPVLRGAAAEARAVLLQLASEKLGVPAARLQVKDGVVSRIGDTSVHTTYGQLVQGRRIERHLEKVPLKAVSAFTLVGHPAARKDALEKVTGRARYAADQALPGTLHARVLRPPAHGARLRRVDTSAAERLPGVRVLREGDLIAVLHERPDAADRALEALKTDWTPSPSTLDDGTIFDHLVKHAPPAETVVAQGNLKAGEAQAARVHEARYLNSYVAHAATETHSAVAQFVDGKATVWASTQAPFMVKAQVARALGLSAQKVRVITPYVGGGFGGKSAGAQAVQAARLARLAGRPVQVVWDRAEEFFQDTFRPAAVVDIRAGVSKEGRLTFWDCKVVGAGSREAGHTYAIPHQRITSAGGWQGGEPSDLHPFGVGAWRAPSANTNVFARESHIDALAAQSGLDPLAFRLANHGDPRMLRVLKLAAERFGWAPRPAPSGRGVGLACGVYRGTYVAAMAEVAVDRVTGRVRVQRVVMAQDMGVVVNPDGAKQQMEGSITMGLGYALTEEVRFKAGEVLDRNFDTYELPRFSWLPRIETILVDNPEVPAQGGGEPPIIVMGALLANAIHDAVGVRMLQLPMTPARILAALRQGGKAAEPRKRRRKADPDRRIDPGPWQETGLGAWGVAQMAGPPEPEG
ncbi:MAG TPA: molybdopterin cofactor-binding domain-containing protein, partial [Holophagaceae bacterium]|nr:molybdopterin cofactor-binding domain-containing protein [Holophagaceae bacterium]